jgi:hypothetical protein
VETSDLPPNGTSIAVDPDWTLAAWSADAGGILGSNRTATTMLLTQLSQMLDGPNFTLDDYWSYTEGYDLDFIR